MRELNENTMVRINDVQEILRKRTYTSRRYRLIDTSGGSSSGYSYDLVEQEKVWKDFLNEDGEIAISDWVWETIRKIASTRDTSMPNARNKIGSLGAYGPTFDRIDISEIL